MAEVVNIDLEEPRRTVRSCTGRDVGDGHEVLDWVMWEADVVVDEVLGDVPGTLCDSAKV